MTAATPGIEQGHRYLPLAHADRQAMLDTIGVASQDRLFDSVPADLQGRVHLPEGLSELELTQVFSAMARENRDLTQWHSFLGAGAYRRFTPAAVLQVIGRPEFFTAYTPYQAEASQGWLQTIFEFQSMIAELTGLPYANASMYEGATALAEAAMMAVNHSGRQKVVIAGPVHPEYVAVMRTYAAGRSVEVAHVLHGGDGRAGGAAIDALREALEGSAALLFQHPNFFGQLEDAETLCALAHDAGALAVVSSDPVALAVLRPPGEFGADIAVGECQSLGIPLWYGGPYCGYLAASEAMLRRMPGRLVGETVDQEGRRGFVLTLQAREQHIRRESASSNICTNQALIALGATAYMAVMGGEGLRRINEVSAQRAHHLADAVTAKGYQLYFDGPFLWEFVMRCQRPASEVLAAMRQKGILGGVDLGAPHLLPAPTPDGLLVAVTEMNGRDSLDAFVEALP